MVITKQTHNVLDNERKCNRIGNETTKNKAEARSQKKFNLPPSCLWRRLTRAAA